MIKLSVYKATNEIPTPTWNRLVYGKGAFLSFSYLKALEDSKLPGLFFRYVILKRKDLPVAAFVFQCVDLGSDELGGVLNLDNYGGVNSSIAVVVNRVLFKRSKGKRPCLLVCGSLLSSGEYGIASPDKKNYMYAIRHYEDVRSAVVNSTGEYKVVAEMVKDFYDDSHSIVRDKLKGVGFPLRTDPEMIVNIDSTWTRFEDYLQALSSKYRVRANAVLRAASNLELRDLSLQDMDDLHDRIEYLFGQVRDKAPVRLVRPDSAYLRALKYSFKERFIVKGYFIQSELVAFRTCLVDGANVEAHYIGMDYNLNKEYSLYQNILYGLIEDAISHRAQKLYLGRTAIEMKTTVGAEANRLSCYLKFSSRIVNTLFKTALSGLGPKEWIPRSPFK
ncbi:MAG: hypothetical protein ACKOYC_07185 [Bacteroidota bacterium]